MTDRKLTPEDYEEAAEEYARDVEVDAVHRFFEPVSCDSWENALPFEVFFDVPDGVPRATW